MKSNYFESKVEIITGSSSGIGEELALRLSEPSASLALAARNGDALGLVADACQRHGGKAVPVPTDVADEAECKYLVERTVDEFGRIDMLVNNAGIDVLARLDDLPDLRLFKRVMDVNFYGSVYCTYYALPYLKRRMEPLDTGVSVSVICPYWVVSRFHENYMDENGIPKRPSGKAIYTEEDDVCRQMCPDRHRGGKKAQTCGIAWPRQVRWLAKADCTKNNGTSHRQEGSTADCEAN